jgi:hypothetical protein
VMTEHSPPLFFAMTKAPTYPASGATPLTSPASTRSLPPEWQVKHTPTKSLPEADIPLPGAGRSS